MPEALNIGPFLLPTVPMAMIGTVLLAMVTSGFVSRRLGLGVSPAIRVTEGAAVSGLLAARAGFVLLNWESYSATPWVALYLWQPGYLWAIGVFAAAMYVAWQCVAAPPSERRGRWQAVLSGYAAAGVAFAATIGVLGMSADGEIPRRGDPSPDFTLHSLDGRHVSLSGLRGAPVVVNFWATWCPPCRREMPVLDAVQDQFASRGVTVVGVNVGETVEEVVDFVRAAGTSYPIWVDRPGTHPEADRTRSVYSRYGGIGLPTTVFIGGDGIVADRYVGELSRASLENWIEAMLSSPIDG